MIVNIFKYFIGTANFTFFNTPLLAGFPKILDFYLKDDELFIVSNIVKISITIYR